MLFYKNTWGFWKRKYKRHFSSCFFIKRPLCCSLVLNCRAACILSLHHPLSASEVWAVLSPGLEYSRGRKQLTHCQFISTLNSGLFQATSNLISKSSYCCFMHSSCFVAVFCWRDGLTSSSVDFEPASLFCSDWNYIFLITSQIVFPVNRQSTCVLRTCTISPLSTPCQENYSTVLFPTPDTKLLFVVWKYLLGGSTNILVWVIVTEFVMSE